MKKILAVLVNYGTDQLNYLEQVVQELKSFKKYDVTIIVNSNIKHDILDIDHVNVVELNDYQLLPLTCKQVLWPNNTVLVLLYLSQIPQYLLKVSYRLGMKSEI